jgi:hypothetical protein
MDTLTRWKCRVGLHQWTEWETTGVGLFPVGDRTALNTVDVETLTLETKHRECKQCRCVQVKQFIHW